MRKILAIAKKNSLLVVALLTISCTAQINTAKMKLQKHNSKITTLIGTTSKDLNTKQERILKVFKTVITLHIYIMAIFFSIGTCKNDESNLIPLNINTLINSVLNE